MSYQAIARKWRPKHFSEIAGQGHVTRTLENAIRMNRVHHAYLFSGPRGVGKTTAARTLARALNCVEGPTTTPCDVCSNCKEILSGSSSNVHEIDGASNNSVEDIRELRDAVQYLPVGGSKKIYIIDEVHMLSKGAFNALLKTLEEPPAHVVFMFATTEPHKIPDTILSRVQRFDFKRIPAQTVVERLGHICNAEGVSIDEDGLRLIARAGEGSMRDAQSLLDQVISFCGKEVALSQITDALGLTDRQLLYEMLEGIVTKDAVLCLDAIEKVYTQGYELAQFSTEMLELLRNATLVALSPKTQRFLDIPESERDVLTGLAKQQSTDVFVRSFQVMLDAHERISRSPRPKLTMEMTVAKLISIKSAAAIEEIVEKIRGVERQKRKKSRSKTVEKDDPAPAKPSQRLKQPSANDTKKRESQQVTNRLTVEDPLGVEDLPPPPDSLPNVSGNPFSEAQKALTKKPSAKKATRPTEPTKDSQQTEDKATRVLSKKVNKSKQTDSLIQEFNAFRNHILTLNKPDLTIWIEEGAIVGEEKGILIFEFPSKFTLEQAKRTQKDVMLIDAVKKTWPNVKAIKAQFRTSSQNENHRERSARLKEEARAALMDKFEQDHRIQEICKGLTMSIKTVRLQSEL